MKCPVCGNEYKRTTNPNNMKEVWEDCLECGMTREDCETQAELKKREGKTETKQRGLDDDDEIEELDLDLDMRGSYPFGFYVDDDIPF